MPGKRVVIAVLFCVLACSLAGITSARRQDQNKDKNKDGINVSIQTKDSDAGLVIKTQATAKEVGLPLYPGSRPHKEDKDDSSGANLGLWGDTFGFRVVALKMESGDSQDKIAAFYQKALAKYGKVLDCTNNPPGTAEKNKNSNQLTLTCQDDRPDSGGRLFKAGTKSKQHIVSIKPSAHPIEFDLVYLEVRSDDTSL